MFKKINAYYQSTVDEMDAGEGYTDEELNWFVVKNIGIVSAAAVTVLVVTSVFY